MFKLFKKYAVLDSIETNDYEAYRIFAQSAGGYAYSRREAERTLLKTYHKAKTTPFSIARVGYSMQYYRLVWVVKRLLLRFGFLEWKALSAIIEG